MNSCTTFPDQRPQGSSEGERRVRRQDITWRGMRASPPLFLKKGLTSYISWLTISASSSCKQGTGSQTSAVEIEEGLDHSLHPLFDIVRGCTAPRPHVPFALTIEETRLSNVRAGDESILSRSVRREQGDSRKRGMQASKIRMKTTWKASGNLQLKLSDLDERYCRPKDCQ